LPQIVAPEKLIAYKLFFFGAKAGLSLFWESLLAVNYQSWSQLKFWEKCNYIRKANNGRNSTPLKGFPP